MDDAIVSLDVDETCTNENLGLLVDTRSPRWIRVDNNVLAVEGLDELIIAKIGRPDLSWERMIQEHILQMILPGSSEEFVHNILRELVEGGIGRSKDSERSISGESFVEISSIDGRCQSGECIGSDGDVVNALGTCVGEGRNDAEGNSFDLHCSYVVDKLNKLAFKC